MNLFLKSKNTNHPLTLQDVMILCLHPSTFCELRAFKSRVLHFSHMKMFRIMMLWLLMLTLPVQGFAAVLRTSCGTEHSRVQLLAHFKVSGDVGVESHYHSEAVDDVALTPASHHDASGVIHHHHHHQHDLKNAPCGSCGSCCVSAFAMMSTHLWTPDFHQALVEIVAPSPLVTGFIPDGLERPPRQISL